MPDPADDSHVRKLLSIILSSLYEYKDKAAPYIFDFALLNIHYDIFITLCTAYRIPPESSAWLLSKWQLVMFATLFYAYIAVPLVPDSPENPEFMSSISDNIRYIPGVSPYVKLFLIVISSSSNDDSISKIDPKSYTWF